MTASRVKSAEKIAASLFIKETGSHGGMGLKMQGVAEETECSVVPLPLAGCLPYLTKENLGTCDVTGGCHNSNNLLVNIETA